MGWTRNLGLQKAEDLGNALEASTWETIPVKTGAGDVVEHKHDMLVPRDRALVAPAVIAAKSAIEALGGQAFIHLQAQDRLIIRHEYGEGGRGDEDTPAKAVDNIIGTKAVRIKCLVITVTTETEIEEK